VSTDFDAQAKTFLGGRRHNVATGLSSSRVSLYNKQADGSETYPRRGGDSVTISLYQPTRC
jgi:hypothetical protein